MNFESAFKTKAEVTFYNPTFEDFEVQADNKVYMFRSQEYTKVNADIAENLYNKWRHRGLFPIAEGQDFDSIRVNALKEYLRNCVDVRIKNHQVYMDECIRAGSTMKEPEVLTELKKIREDLAAYLGVVVEKNAPKTFMSLVPQADEEKPQDKAASIVEAPIMDIKNKKAVKKKASQKEDSYLNT